MRLVSKLKTATCMNTRRLLIKRSACFFVPIGCFDVIVEAGLSRLRRVVISLLLFALPSFQIFDLIFTRGMRICFLFVLILILIFMSAVLLFQTFLFYLFYQINKNIVLPGSIISLQNTYLSVLVLFIGYM